MRIPIIPMRVLDQDRALRFYTETLGFTVTEDMDFGGHMRWITVAPPGDPEQQVLLERVGPPIVDQETADQIDALIAKGVGGTLFLQGDDCRKTVEALGARGRAHSRVVRAAGCRKPFDELVAKGVEVSQEPRERFYGIDAAIRD